jgi:hypothetical protein
VARQTGSARLMRASLLGSWSRVPRLALVVELTVVLTFFQAIVWSSASDAAQDPLLNCNQLELDDRCECNHRILRALNDIKAATPDPQSRNSGPADILDAVQEERRHRLRTFYAPDCDQASSASNLPARNERSTRFANRTLGRYLRPFLARVICEGERCKTTEPSELLVGRWTGWQTLPDGKTVPIAFHIAEYHYGFVRACSDHGMVFGMVRDGFLELPGPPVSGLANFIRLWKAAPHFRDLEGVALLELGSNEELPGGPVWLTKVQTLRGFLPPTGYFCEARELEDRRTVPRQPPELTTP